MTPLALIVGSVALFCLCWLVSPRVRPKPEVRGVLVPLWWFNRLYTSFLHRLEIQADAPLPAEAAAILISNHTCGIDHLILQAGTRRLLGFMITEAYYNHPVYHPFCKMINCIPVKTEGNDATALRAGIRALRDGRVLPIFPEGRINPSSGREFHDPKPGAAYLALRTGVPVIPAYISGTPPTAEIPAVCFTPSHARLVFGPPIDLSDLMEGKGHQDERARVDEAMHRMFGAIVALRDQTLGLKTAEPAVEAPVEVAV